MTLRRLSRWAARVLLAVVLLIGAGTVLIESPWGHERVRRILIAQSARLLAGQLDIKTVTGSLWGGTTLSGVRLVQEGRPILAADEIRLRYSLWGFLRGSIDLDEVILDHPAIAIIENDRGWNVTMMLAARQSASAGPARPVTIHHLSVTGGSVEVVPRTGARREFGGVRFDGAVSYTDGRLSLTSTRFDATDLGTGVTIRQLAAAVVLDRDQFVIDRLDLQTSATHLTGHLSVRDRSAHPTIDADLTADRFSVPEIARYVPAAARIGLTGRARVRATGPWDTLQADWDLQSSGGSIAGHGVFDLSSPTHTARGDVAVAGLNLAAFTGRTDLASTLTFNAAVTVTLPPRGWADAAVHFDVEAPSVTLRDYHATRVRARGVYRASGLEAKGVGTAYGASATYDLAWTPRTSRVTATGDATHVDLRRLPAGWGAPALATDVASHYILAIDSRGWGVDAALADSTVEGAVVAAGSTVHVENRSGAITYMTVGQVSTLDVDRIVRVVRHSAPDTRLQSRIDGAFRLEGCGTWASLVDHDLAAAVQLTHSTIGGIDVEALEARGRLSERELTADVSGRLQGVSWPADAVAGAPSSSTRLNGAFDAHVLWHDISAPIQPTSMDGRVMLDVGPSTVAGLALNRANVEATVDAGLATLTRVEVDGPAVKADAQGTLALGDRGESALTYTIDARDLAPLGAMVAQPPMAGTAHLEGRVTGTHARTTVQGTLTGHELRRETASALTLAGDYTVQIPDLAVARAEVVSNLVGTFVQIGRTKIDRLSTTVKYVASTLDVVATIEQPERTITAEAEISVAPDQQQARVRQLAMNTGGTIWKLTEPAVVRYGPAVSVSHLVLASGDARLTFDGAVPATSSQTGGGSGTLTITAERVQLAELDTMLLGTKQLAGQIDGTATVTGSVDKPEVDADLHVTGGRAGTVPFEDLTVRGGYRDRIVRVDARLRVDAAGELTLTGTTPINGDGMDIRAQTAGIQAAFFEPLGVAHVDQIHGTVRFNLQVSGALRGPSVHGTVSLADGQMRIVPTGEAYRAFNAEVRFDGDKVTVDTLSVEDDDGHRLTMSGSSAGGGADRSFDLTATSTDFHLLHNKLGELALGADLHVTGSMQAPHVAGRVKVERGVLEVDQILNRATKTAYEPVGGTPATPAPEAAPRQHLFSDATIDVNLDIPDNLVLRGRDLRTTAGSIGLGDINVTAGGRVRVTKAAGGGLIYLGDVSIVRGNYSFQGRRFDIENTSQIRLTGEEPFDPVLNIAATREIAGVTARVNVVGTMRRPEISLSSDPPLDPGDVLSLIVFNQPINELGELDQVSLAERAGTIAAGAVASPLAASVAHALDLDVFEIRSAETAGGGPTITVGRQVSDRLFIGFRHEFGNDETSHVSFEYRLRRFFRLVTSIGQGSQNPNRLPREETAGLDLFFVIKK